MATQASNRFPSQIKYIVGNEAAERFSFYGMRSILVVFMTGHLLFDDSHAKSVFHLFVAANYFMPLLGGYLADRYLGKYRTILYLSLLYCVGHGILAVWESAAGMYAGLAFIALGSGGIKPCVSAHVGDQFTEKNKHLLEKVYELFYFSINFGSFFSSLLIPWTLPRYGASVAFGIPGILMGIATFVFWMGRKYYVIVPPSGKENQSNFLGIVIHSILNLGKRKPGQHFLEVARSKYDEERVEGAKAAVDVFKVFILVSIFWSLFDQTGSSWVLQATQMDLNWLGMQWEASQLQALNPLMVMFLIPLFSKGIYPGLRALGFEVTPLQKMSAGMLMAGVSFAAAGIFQLFIESGHSVSVGWQSLSYFILTAAEILVSITGLEFAYTQAPRSLKSTIMSLWMLTFSLGNLFTALISYLDRFDGAMEFFFYGALSFLVSLVFIFIASRYKVRSYMEPDKA